jgi:carbamoyl-phosphate synthase large subunit
LLSAFRRAAEALDVDLEIHGADINRTAPAIYSVDRPHIVPRIRDRKHIPALLKLVKTEGIDAVIPLIDSDLEALSAAADRFAEHGARVIISDVDVIRTCADKLLTYRALRDAGIDTPRTWCIEELAGRKRHQFPYFMKPRRGSAGQGLYRIDCADELKVFANRTPGAIVQDFVEGIEHTLDVYTGLDGVPRCVVPRRRLEVRTGEVSKGLIVKRPKIMRVGRRVAEALGACRGVITVQCMVKPRQPIQVIEINPRFGGGAPLSIAAGADFPKWLMAELLGRRLRVNYEGFRDNLAMLRYDESVFVDGDIATSRGASGRQRTRRMT